MKKYKVTFFPEEVTIEIPENSTILEAATQAGIEIRAICGGAGTCKRCKGIVKEGAYQIPSGYKPEEKGEILCCQTLIEDNLKVVIPTSSRITDTSILLGGDYSVEEFSPVLETRKFKLNPPEFGKNASDLTRLSQAIQKKLNTDKFRVPLSEIRKLPDLLRENNWKASVSFADLGTHYQASKLQSDDEDKDFCLAVDIGTTTVVVSLIDLKTGAEIIRRGQYNRQGRYGEDIITRIVYTTDKKDGLEKLQQAIMETLDMLIKEVSASAGIKPDQIMACTCAGNTTMIHLLLGINPNYLRIEPYVPAATAPPPIQAQEINLPINSQAWVHFLPGVSSYVGGDITAGLLAIGIAQKDEITLFLDIGTNGELVLGNREWLLSCACSAGPAFEGSETTSGVRAMKGAIEKFTPANNSKGFNYQTIGGEKPLGICGSGFISLLSTLSDAGILERNGTFNTEKIKSSHLREPDGERELILVDEKETRGGEDIVIRESDLDNLLRAKAAIFAGIRVMLGKVSLEPSLIENILVAGGFGNHLPLQEAIKIGLLPDVSKNKFSFLGNTSLTGAQLYLLSRQARENASELAAKMTYLELSKGNEFTEEFISARFIPHTDFSLFPSVEQ